MTHKLASAAKKSEKAQGLNIVSNLLQIIKTTTDLVKSNKKKENK